MIYVDAVNEIISIICEHFSVPHWSTWYHLSHLSFCLCSKSSMCSEVLLFKRVVRFVLFLLFRTVLIRAWGGCMSFSKLIYFHDEIKKLKKKKCNQTSILHVDRKMIRFIRTLSWPQWIYCAPDLLLYWRKLLCDKEMNISAMIFTLEIYMVF